MQYQYIIEAATPEAIIARARAAMADGARWIEIKAPEALGNDELAPIVDALRPELAKDEVMLILADRPQAAHDLKCDGVHLYSLAEPVSKVRMQIEAWPIIGVSVADSAAAAALRAFDIDYLYFEADKYDDATLDKVRDICRYLREAELETPLVCGGDIPTELIPTLEKEGVTSIAVRNK